MAKIFLSGEFVNEDGDRGEWCNPGTVVCDVCADGLPHVGDVDGAGITCADCGVTACADCGEDEATSGDYCEGCADHNRGWAQNN